MLSIHLIEARFPNLSPDLLDVVMELRNIVAQIAPGVTEESMHSGMVYYMSERGGHVSAGVCLIRVYPDHIRLAFFHGAFLPDPEHLLRGNQVAMRDLNIYSYETAPWEAIRDLIEASYRFDPYTQTFRS
jgi:hypothetical protein